MQPILWSAENEFLAVVLHADASAGIRDKTNGAARRMGPVALQEEGAIEVGHVWLRTDRSSCEQFRAGGEARLAVTMLWWAYRMKSVMSAANCAA